MPNFGLIFIGLLQIKISLLVFLVSIIIHCQLQQNTQTQTICEQIINGECQIQGVVFPTLDSKLSSTAGLLFVQNVVFEFDINERVPQIRLRKAGQYIHQYFANLDLFDDLHSVFALHSKEESSKIYFILTNNNDDIVYGKYFNKSRKASVMYDLDRQRMFELKRSADKQWFPMLPRYHPFLYFSNNLDTVYMHQLPFCFQHNLCIPLSTRNSSYCWTPINPNYPRTLSTDRIPVRQKLVGAFVLQDHFYLVASKHVYQVEYCEMQNSYIPKFNKVPIHKFLLCHKTAILPDRALIPTPSYSAIVDDHSRFVPTDWLTIYKNLICLVLVLILLILFTAFVLTVKSILNYHARII